MSIFTEQEICGKIHEYMVNPASRSELIMDLFDYDAEQIGMGCTLNSSSLRHLVVHATTRMERDAMGGRITMIKLTEEVHHE